VNIAVLLYNLLIFPLVMVIDLSYVVVERIFRSQGIAVIGVGIVVSALTLPLYIVAEKWQTIERDKIKSLKPVVDVIKAVFSGDEQYMILSTYYRQQRYHPVYAMRSTFGLLIQVPFFIAAYSYLSRLKLLEGESFFLISNLAAPDGLLRIGSLSFNALPVLMTALNILAGFIYTRGFPLKDKVQLYGMAAVFLVLLYASPSGLVLYWTVNNAISLIKNILLKIKFSRRAAYVLFALALVFINYVVLFGIQVSRPKRVFFVFASAFALVLPFLPALLKTLKTKVKKYYHDFSVFGFSVLLFSCIILVFLAGLIIPGSTIASSVEEFSFLEGRASPLPFLAITFVQASGVFLVLPVCVYFLFAPVIRKGISLCFFFFAITAVINYFLFPSDYGFLRLTMYFSQGPDYNIPPGQFFLNLLAVTAVFSVMLFIARKNKFVFRTLLLVVMLASCGLGLLNIYLIQRDFASAAVVDREGEAAPEHFFRFSKTDPNVLVIMMDKAVGAFAAPVFEEKPELAESLSGFTWYPNSVSYSTYTLLGAPPLFGGYEYTPRGINARPDVTLRDKYFEAESLLVSLFTGAGYSASLSDLPYSDLKRMTERYDVKADNFLGNFTASWLERHPQVSVVSIRDILSNKLVRLSFFKIMPPFFRIYFYDEGDWLSLIGWKGAEGRGELTLDTVDNLALLDAYPALTYADEGRGGLNIAVNLLTHESAWFQYPGYTESSRVTDTGNGPCSDDPVYHVNMKGFLGLAKWFDKLKAEGVYDNTRIIIVSDHGDFIESSPREGFDKYQFNCLLMVKDFNARGPLAADNTFMTNADTALIAVEGVIPRPRNPFTGKELKPDKASGIDICNMRLSDFNDHGAYTYRIPPDQWLHVRDDIFNPGSWKAEK
jgi:YidC/Oxa1 family membrane protein insertase